MFLATMRQCRTDDQNGLGENVMVFDGPFGVSRCRSNLRRMHGRITHTQYTELCRHAPQILANTIEVGIRGIARQSCGYCVLGTWISWHRFPGWVQQNGVDGREISKHSKKSGELCSRSHSNCACKQFVLHVSPMLASMMRDTNSQER